MLTIDGEFPSNNNNLVNERNHRVWVSELKATKHFYSLFIHYKKVCFARPSNFGHLCYFFFFFLASKPKKLRCFRFLPKPTNRSQRKLVFQTFSPQNVCNRLCPETAKKSFVFEGKSTNFWFRVLSR